MKAVLGGAGLLLLSGFMLLGFMTGDVDRTSLPGLIALLVAVGVPGVTGATLIARHVRSRGQFGQRREALRQQTIEAEVLRLAGRSQGKLTIVEVVSELALTPEAAKTALDNLARGGLADFEVTDSGVIVYAFHDVQRLGEKSAARGILDG